MKFRESFGTTHFDKSFLVTLSNGKDTHGYRRQQLTTHEPRMSPLLKNHLPILDFLHRFSCQFFAFGFPFSLPSQSFGVFFFFRMATIFREGLHTPCLYCYPVSQSCTHFQLHHQPIIIIFWCPLCSVFGVFFLLFPHYSNCLTLCIPRCRIWTENRFFIHRFGKNRLK